MSVRDFCPCFLLFEELVKRSTFEKFAQLPYLAYQSRNYLITTFALQTNPASKQLMLHVVLQSEEVFHIVACQFSHLDDSFVDGPLYQFDCRQMLVPCFIAQLHLEFEQLVETEEIAIGWFVHCTVHHMDQSKQAFSIVDY